MWPAFLFLFFHLIADEGIQHLPFAVSQLHDRWRQQVILPEQEIHRLHFAIGLDQFFAALSAFSWVV